jgi:hypothetical protein
MEQHASFVSFTIITRVVLYCMVMTNVTTVGPSKEFKDTFGVVELNQTW